MSDTWLECDNGCHIDDKKGILIMKDCPTHDRDGAMEEIEARLIDFLREKVKDMKDMNQLPTDSQERKDLPLVSGCLDYFPAALAEVARLSKYGNDKHNPGEELHHARGKSTDHADCIVRHLMERGTMDPSGFSHSVMVAWRALALLQQELEDAGAPLARGARPPETDDHSPFPCPDPACGYFECMDAREAGVMPGAIEGLVVEEPTH